MWWTGHKETTASLKNPLFWKRSDPKQVKGATTPGMKGVIKMTGCNKKMMVATFRDRLATSSFIIGWVVFLDTTKRLHFPFSLSCIGGGNGNPLQCSCLECPRAGGVWWAAVYGVAQSRTRLKWLSSSSYQNSIAIVVQSFSCVWLFATLWTAACQASLSFTISWSLLKLMSIESGILSNHFILCCPLLLLSSVFLSIRVFSNESESSHWVAKVTELQFQHQSFQWVFRIDFL